MTLSQRAVEAAVSSYDNAPDAIEADVAMNLAIHVALAVDGLCLVPIHLTENMAAAMECEFSTEAQWAAALAAASDGEDSPPAGTEG